MIFAWVALVVASQCQNNLLSSISFGSDISRGVSLPTNFAGVSLLFGEMYSSALSSQLFAGFFKNSWVYGSTSASWGISLKMQWPVGYKYDCPNSWTTIVPNATCLLDVKPYYSAIGTFFKSAANSYRGLSLGFDRQGLNANSSSFSSFFSPISSYTSSAVGTVNGGRPDYEFFDQADRYNAMNMTPMNYTPALFMNEAYIVYYSIPNYVLGPGLSETATADWMDIYSSSYYYGKFTLYATVFKSLAQLTIDNVLNQANYLPYIQKRLSNSNGPVILDSQRIMITDLAMAPQGLDGITNTMVSAIWALDFLLEAVRYGVGRVLLNVNLTAGSMLGPFGPGPDFQPQPIYYALIMMSIVQQDATTYSVSSEVRAGFSGSIKVHSFISDDTLSVVLINKDPRPEAKGIVWIESQSRGDIACIYMTASSLTSKNLTLGGYWFVGGNSTPQGSYSSLTFPNNGSGYAVPLNWAEVAYCRVLSPNLALRKVTLGSAYFAPLAVFLLLLLLF